MVVEGLKAGTKMLAVVTADEFEFRDRGQERCPDRSQGRACRLDAGGTAIKYGEDIGKFVAPVKKGEHVHVHNLKTKRW